MGSVSLIQWTAHQLRRMANTFLIWLTKCIDDIGEKNVVQVVTDNASVNLAAAALLKAKRPSIFWNGCAAHTIDLMLENIAKIPEVDKTIVKARSLTTFLYSHARVLALMRTFLGKDLVRSGITRFATAYLNLKSLLENKKELGRLFRSDELNEMGYFKKGKGKDVPLSSLFWFYFRLMPFQSTTQVHAKKRTKLTHDRMRHLVFVKFNSLLRHKKMTN